MRYRVGIYEDGERFAIHNTDTIEGVLESVRNWLEFGGDKDCTVEEIRISLGEDELAIEPILANHEIGLNDDLEEEYERILRVRSRDRRDAQGQGL